MLDFGLPGPAGPVATVARTAVVAGTATAVAGSVAHRQQEKYAREDAAAVEARQAAAPVASESNGDAEPDYIVELRQLAELKASGLITAAEFDAKKKQILGI